MMEMWLHNTSIMQIEPVWGEAELSRLCWIGLDETRKSIGEARYVLCRAYR